MFFLNLIVGCHNEWDQENKIEQKLNFDTDCLGLFFFLVLFNNLVTFFRESNRTKY